MNDKRKPITEIRTVQIKGYSGIYRIEIRDQASCPWREPKRGAKFQVIKYANGKRLKRHFHSFDEAKAFRQQDSSIEGEPVQQAPTTNSTGAMTFRELVEKWKEIWLPGKNLSTQIRYKSYLKHFDFLHLMQVERIDSCDVDRWINHVKTPVYLKAGHKTRCDYKHEFSVLRIILNFYVSRCNRSYRLPFIKDHREMLKVREKPNKPKKDLTVEQFQKFTICLRQICDEAGCLAIYFIALMQYAIYSRVQEVAALHFEDFDFARGKINVNKKVQWLRARGYEDQIVAGSKKNGGKEIPISELAERTFKEWISRSGVRNGLLFRQEDDDPSIPLTYRQIESRYTQALKMAGLPFTATHILRHASLTEYYDTCKDLLATAVVGGHDDVRSTMKYAKSRDERVSQIQKQMDAKLGGIEV